MFTTLHYFKGGANREESKEGNGVLDIVTETQHGGRSNIIEDLRSILNRTKHHKFSVEQTSNENVFRVREPNHPREYKLENKKLPTTPSKHKTSLIEFTKRYIGREISEKSISSTELETNASFDVKDAGRDTLEDDLLPQSKTQKHTDDDGFEVADKDVYADDSTYYSMQENLRAGPMYSNEVDNLIDSGSSASSNDKEMSFGTELDISYNEDEPMDGRIESKQDSFPVNHDYRSGLEYQEEEAESKYDKIDDIQRQSLPIKASFIEKVPETLRYEKYEKENKKTKNRFPENFQQRFRKKDARPDYLSRSRQDKRLGYDMSDNPKSIRSETKQIEKDKDVDTSHSASNDMNESREDENSVTNSSYIIKGITDKNHKKIDYHSSKGSPSSISGHKPYRSYIERDYSPKMFNKSLIQKPNTNGNRLLPSFIGYQRGKVSKGSRTQIHQVTTTLPGLKKDNTKFSNQFEYQEGDRNYKSNMPENAFHLDSDDNVQNIAPKSIEESADVVNYSKDHYEIDSIDSLSSENDSGLNSHSKSNKKMDPSSLSQTIPLNNNKSSEITGEDRDFDPKSRDSETSSEPKSTQETESESFENNGSVIVQVSRATTDVKEKTLKIEEGEDISEVEGHALNLDTDKVIKSSEELLRLKLSSDMDQGTEKDIMILKKNLNKSKSTTRPSNNIGANNVVPEMSRNSKDDLRRRIQATNEINSSISLEGDGDIGDKKVSFEF